MAFTVVNCWSKRKDTRHCDLPVSRHLSVHFQGVQKSPAHSSTKFWRKYDILIHLKHTEFKVVIYIFQEIYKLLSFLPRSSSPDQQKLCNFLCYPHMALWLTVRLCFFLIFVKCERHFPQFYSLNHEINGIDKYKVIYS